MKRFGADRERTLAQIATLTAEIADIVAGSQLVATDDEHDPEGATIAFERARIEALLAAARAHLSEIDLAEMRILTGRYGICTRCGQSISAERLEARPTAATCIACAAIIR